MCIPIIDDQAADAAPESAPREAPPWLLRNPEAAVFWWGSNRSLLIVQGDLDLELKPDEVAALANFMRGCSVGAQPL